MLKTEMRNEASTHIDKMDTLEMLQLINRENMNSVMAVEAALDDISKVCDVVAEQFRKGGRLLYVGAGTSGRLGVMDVAECPPTYGVSREQICDKDVVVGISASGGASYVVGALEYANKVGAVTVSLCSNRGSKMESVAKYSIVTDTGAEVITGSTRMKSGNAQKFVLNMISTAAMVKTGKVYENMMINLKPTNQKLRARVVRIVCEILHCTPDEAILKLDLHNWDIRETVENA